MPTYTVYARRVDIVRLETTIEAVGINRARQVAQELELDGNEDSFEFVDSDSPDGIEITYVEEKKED